MPLFIAVAFSMLVFTLAILEKRKHQQNLNLIKTRIIVNGIRGKSTVTRLIFGILKEAGIQVIGKTTGTSPRMIYWFTEDEKVIKRFPEGPNIREQITVIAEAAKVGAKVLVSECMAVHPDYQATFQEEMMQAPIVVITNVLEDHMEIMGPNLKFVAEALASTIPYKGTLVISDGPYRDYFQTVAKHRGTEVVITDVTEIPSGYLNQFKYMVFPENVSLALSVAKVMGIDKETAFKGMLKANPDPGALRILNLNYQDKTIPFVNAFAANDPVSTVNIWHKIRELGFSTQSPMVIMNCRYDRVDRTEQFIKEVLPHISIHILILIGEITKPVTDAYNRGKFKSSMVIDFEGQAPEKVFNSICEYIPQCDIVYGIGNIHGQGENVIHMLESISSDYPGDYPSAYLEEEIMTSTVTRPVAAIAQKIGLSLGGKIDV